MKAILYGKVEKGKLIILNEEIYERVLESLEGQEITFTIGKKTRPRSNQQNRYYWGVIIEILGKELGYTPEETHEALKIKFLLKEGGKIPTVRSTAELSTVEMEEYHSKIREWASQFLGCYIPDPSEVEV